MKFQEAALELEASREREGKCSNEVEIELTVHLGVIEWPWGTETKAGQHCDGTEFSDIQEPNLGISECSQSMAWWLGHKMG